MCLIDAATTTNLIFLSSQLSMFIPSQLHHHVMSFGIILLFFPAARVF